MAERFEIKLLERIRHVPVETSFQRVFRNLGVLILLPLIIVVALLAIISMGVVSLYQKVTRRQPKAEAEEPKWYTFVKMPSLTILSKFAGEIRFGPEYVYLNSQPEIHELNGKIFGDWFFIWGKHLFLQQWNSVENADANLVALNTETYEMIVAHENIPAVAWHMESKQDGSLQLVCNTGNERFQYLVSGFQNS